MAAAGLSLPEFSVAKCTFKVYKQVFENKMKIHEVDKMKWSQYLISFIGFDMVTLLSELCFPKTPQDKTYTELVELIEKHLEPQQSEIAETYKFMKREQLTDESICEFVAALKKLAQTCNFTIHLERCLRDKFVHGLKSESIVKRLFSEENLTFAKAVEIAMSMELAEKGAKLITAGSTGQESSDIYKISGKHVSIKCHCCGKMGHLKPLYTLLKNSEKWVWSKQQELAYEWAKKAIVSDQVLIHYNPKLPVVLSCDASKYGLGACLAHEIRLGNNIVERPIAFASRTLNEAEVKYSQIDKEALAIIWAVKKFDLYLKGRTFTLVTDHKPLISIFNPNKTAGSIYADRMTRWALILCNYNYEIKYRTSQHNAAADFPSRLPIKNSNEEDNINLEGNINSIVLDNPPVTLSEIAKHTRKDPNLSKVCTYLREGWPKLINKELCNFKGKETELYIIKDCILWRDRVVIPDSLKDKVLTELHSGHLGINKMLSLANSCFWWPNITNDIKTITNNCAGCIQNRNLPSIKPTHRWEWPEEPWKRIHADFAGPFLGHMWLIIVDAHSKWPEVVKMNNITSSSTIKCLRSIFARFGLPEQMVTDNGPQWTSEEFNTFCKNNNIRHIYTAPYHPASNGLAERGVQTFKKAMLAYKFDKNCLDHSIQQWLLAYRTAPHAITGKAPCELMFGRKLRTRLSLIKKDVIIPRQLICKKPVKQYVPGDKVLIASYDSSRKWLDGVIEKPVGNVMYDVNTDKGILTRNVTQCLPNYSVPKESDLEQEKESEKLVVNDPLINKEIPSSIANSPILVQPEVRRSARTRKPVQKLDL